MMYSRFYSILALVVLLLLFPLGAIAAPQSAPQAAVMAGASPEVPAFFYDGGTVVVWNSPKQVSKKEVIQYLVWRDGAPVGAVDCVMSLPYNGSAGSWEYSWIDMPFPREFEYLSVGSKNNLVPAMALAQGCTSGVQHEYAVTCVYQVNSPKAAKPVYKVLGPIYAGRATLLARPVPMSPRFMEYVDTSNVTFEWQGCAGADEYVIEVSPTPDFQRDKTWVAKVYRPTVQDGTPCSQACVDVLPTAPELANVPPGSALFWRVGARNSADVPGPIPAGPSPAADGEKCTRYIYSSPMNTLMFITLPDLPPPPPDDGGGSGGDNPPPPPPL